MLESLVEEHHFCNTGKSAESRPAYIAGVESCAEDLLKRDASEKIGNIQL